MALLESISIPLGTKMPSFVLKNPQGKEYKFDNVVGEKGILVVFTCNHCPYALAVWDRFIAISKQAKLLGISTVAINPNIHPDYPQDSPQKMIDFIKNKGISFPYLVDESQQIARLYKAQCTPDIFLLTQKGLLFYHGRIDDNWQYPNKVTNHDLLAAINALANDLEAPLKQFPSMGCSIKWK